MYISRIDWNVTADLPPKTARILGWIWAICGSVLTIGMTVLTLAVMRIVFNPHNPGAGYRFNGGPVAATFVFTVFAFVLALGVAFLVSGIWQIRHGRRHPNALAWVRVAFLGFAALGFLVSVISFIESL